MKIAYILSTRQDQANELLAALAEQLAGQGAAICACIQKSCNGLDRRSCDMDVRLMPSGEQFRISQNLGKDARGCRLNSHALELAVARMEQDIQPHTQMLIINKYGKLEAEGRGFTQAIVKALDLDIPVLLAVNTLNQQDLRAFAGDYLIQLECRIEAVTAWAQSAMKSVKQGAQ